MCDQQEGSDRNQADRREIAQCVVGDLLLQIGQDHQCAGAAEEERVAVGYRFRRQFGANQAAGATPVVDDELLTELRGEPRQHHARDDVGRAAGGHGHDHAHRLFRIGLRGGERY